MRISWASGIGAWLLIGLGLMLGGCGGSGSVKSVATNLSQRKVRVP